MFAVPYLSRLSTLTQTASPLPAVVAQRVALSLEAIRLFIPLIPRNLKEQMSSLTRPAMFASTKRAFATTSATLPAESRVSFL